MPDYSKNNFISIAKAIGIILMVAGHSGCPTIINNFLYLFHMPLFFVCSGYFFKDINNSNELTGYYKRKIIGLYYPYFKWSLFFLIFHNIFVLSNITHSNIYDFNEYIKQILNICLMTDYEVLIRPFWFIKELLLSSILIATLSLLRKRFLTTVNDEILACILLFFTVLCKYYINSFSVLGNVSILTLSIFYIYIGKLYHKYEKRIKTRWTTVIVCFIIILLGSIYYIGIIDMRYTTISNVLQYFILSITGIIMVFTISKLTNIHINSNSYIYYIGNHTMPILALNLLALKIGNLIKIHLYDLPIKSLSSHTIIYDYNDYFWILYIIIGVSFPLLIEYIYIIFKKNIR